MKNPDTEPRSALERPESIYRLQGVAMHKELVAIGPDAFSAVQRNISVETLYCQAKADSKGQV